MVLVVDGQVRDRPTFATPRADDDCVAQGSVCQGNKGCTWEASESGM